MLSLIDNCVRSIAPRVMQLVAFILPRIYPDPSQKERGPHSCVKLFCVILVEESQPAEWLLNVAENHLMVSLIH